MTTASLPTLDIKIASAAFVRPGQYDFKIITGTATFADGKVFRFYAPAQSRGLHYVNDKAGRMMRWGKRHDAICAALAPIRAPMIRARAKARLVLDREDAAKETAESLRLAIAADRASMRFGGDVVFLSLRIAVARAALRRMETVEPAQGTAPMTYKVVRFDLGAHYWCHHTQRSAREVNQTVLHYTMDFNEAERLMDMEQDKTDRPVNICYT